ncbi:MAG: hypothetical protein JXA71_02840, partial [Chitinispirillaceae bacterium]|nr:hypothetical protein [Chitinispirillaceae bacterium]
FFFINGPFQSCGSGAGAGLMTKNTKPAKPEKELFDGFAPLSAAHGSADRPEFPARPDCTAQRSSILN